MELLSEVWRRAFRKRDRRPIYEWASDEAEGVTLPPVIAKDGKFSVNNSRHFIGPFNALADDYVSEVNVLKPVRGGGTLIADITIAHRVANDPSAILAIFQDETIAESHAELRGIPTLKSVRSVRDRLPADKNKDRKNEIIFADGLPLIFAGPAISNLQSRAFRLVWIDECWLIAEKYPGRIEEAKARLGDYIKLGNSKFLGISQGGRAGDDWDNQCSAGERNEWFIECQGCHKHFEGKIFGRRDDGSRWGLMWDEHRDDNGLWIPSRVIPTLRYTCPHCGFAHVNEGVTKHNWNNTGYYQVVGPEIRDKKTFHWTAIIDFPWKNLLELWLDARNSAHHGSDVKTIQFFQKRAAENYDPAKHVMVQTLPATVPVKSEGKFWDKQDYLMMGIDVQQDHFWALVAAVSKSGEIMVLWAGRLVTWGQLDQKQQEFGIPHRCVFVDAKFGMRQAEVYRECTRRGSFQGGEWACWTCFKGDDAEEFIYTIRTGKKRGEKVGLPYSWPPDRGDPCIGLHADDVIRRELQGLTCKVIWWSNPTIKDIAGHYRKKMMLGEKLLVAPGVGEDFAKHMFAENKKTFPDKRTGKEKWKWVRIGQRPNHLWDCFCEIITAMVMEKIIGEFNPSENQPDNNNPKPAQ